MSASGEPITAGIADLGTEGGRAVGRPVVGPRRRRLVLLRQILVVGAVAVLTGVVARNTVLNLESRGLASGFDFLWQEAGFRVGFSLIQVDASSTYGRVFLVGLLNSLLVAGVAMATATLLGFVIGLARVSPNPPARTLAKAYVELVRNLPLLLHLLLWQGVILRSAPTVREAFDLGGAAFLSNRGLYLPALAGATAMSVVLLSGALVVAAAGIVMGRNARHRGELLSPGASAALATLALALLVAATSTADWQLPELAGFDYRGGIKIMPELLALIAALTVYNAAFIAEIVRAGIESVGDGQRQAATALGLPRKLTMRLVVVPQAIRVMIPPTANQYAHLIKASALATVVGVPDLVNVFMGTALNQTGRAVEIVAMTAAVYLTLTAAVALATGWYNRHVRLVER